ncbi:hypothetical protein KQI49_03915 [Virgibacillus sp. MSJ-26]|uniref:YesK family protein n=1 Tax=Virgibacillus sp. MSJ-26 TaxID=2841522 RepID=UPI001C1195FE|nr:YesK family protein [Virgibacillus sp. MSJ-26]MBU5465974.1 hypothetical protein [Virgibacillus sp. MSJ-26]
MGLLIGLLIATVIILLTTTLYFQSKKSPLQYFIPIGVIILSLILIGISFIVGAWEGIGLGTIGFTLFIGSAIPFIMTAIIANMKELKKSYWDQE